jgi:TIR domain-containing protein
VARLEAESIRCWVAPRDVIPGADWGESIIDAIESSRIMILVFSCNANVSRQIKREVERADDKGVYIIPFRIDDIEPTKSLEYFISTAQWMNAFSPPLEPHLDALTKAVATVLASSSPPAKVVPNESKRPKIRPAAVAGEEVPVRRQGIASERRAPLPLRSWILPVAIVAILIVGGAGWYSAIKKSGPQKSVIRQGAEKPSPLSKEVQDATDLKVPESMTTNAAPPARARSVPEIAGTWRDSDYRSVPRSPSMGIAFTLRDRAPSPMELDSNHPATVRFLGKALPAPTTRDIKLARPRGVSVRARYHRIKCV